VDLPTKNGDFPIKNGGSFHRFLQLGPLRKSLVGSTRGSHPRNRGWPGKYPTLVLNNRGIICELEKY